MRSFSMLAQLRVRMGWPGLGLGRLLLFSLVLSLGACGSEEAATPLPSSVAVQAPAQLETGTATAFSALFTPASAGGNGLNWHWDFGDGRSSTLPAPQHSYSVPGSYTVTVTLRNRDGQQVQGTHSLRVGAFARLQGRDCTQAAAAGWCWMAPAQAVRAVLDVHFADSLHGVAVGELGHVLTTRDGGASWQREAPALDETLHLVRMADTRQVWAVSQLTSRLLRSQDGGRTWQLLSRAPLESVRELWVTTAGQVVLAGLGPGLADATWVSSDGGLSWRQSACHVRAVSAGGTLWAANLTAVSHDLGQSCQPLWSGSGTFVLGASVVNDQAVRIVTTSLSADGVWLGYQLVTSSDGGRSFALLPASFPELPTGIVPVNIRLGTDGKGVSTLALLGGPWTAVDIPTTPPPTATLFTRDGGQTWQRGPEFPNLYVLDERFPNAGYADDNSRWYRVTLAHPQQPLRAAAVLVDPDDASPLLIQVPGETDSPVQLRRVAGGRLLAGFGALDAQRWYSSPDRGRSWVALPGSAGPEADVSTGGVWFFDHREGLWLRGDGVVLSTGDGGRSWQQRAVVGTGAAGAAHGLSFTADGATGWLLASGALYRSSDRGRNWQPVGSAPASVRQAQFIDAQRGWVAAWTCTEQGQLTWCEDSLYRTQDGGLSWQTTVSGDFDRLAFADAQRGTWVDQNGFIRHTRDGGLTWSVATTDRPLSQRAGALHFDRQGRGWLIPSIDGTRLLRSLDGGASWQSLALPAVGGLLRGSGYASISFADSQRGWLVGGRGVVLVTQDGGNTWRQQALGTTRVLSHVFATDASTAWIGSSYPAALLSTSTGGD